jgi:hypothetical protein
MSEEPEGPEKDPPAEPLGAYRARRSADRTPEPFGGESATTSPEATAVPEQEPPPGPASSSRRGARRVCARPTWWGRSRERPGSGPT